MNQIHADLDIRQAETGRQLGHDLFSSRMTAGGDGWPATVREGYLHASSRTAHRHRADRYERKWLQLRLNAYQRGRVVDEAVTPALLQRIDVSTCPVTRRRLTHAERGADDWSVDRVNNEGGYGPSNLAVMSVAANAAKGALGFGVVMQRAGGEGASGGLSPMEWGRMGALMLGPCHGADPAGAPIIALTAAMPAGLALTGAQLIQHAFTTFAITPRGKNALLRQLRAACRHEAARQRLEILTGTVHAACKALEFPCDAWLRPVAMAALQSWRSTLCPASWAHAAEIAGAMVGTRRFERTRIEAWQLASRGYAH